MQQRPLLRTVAATRPPAWSRRPAHHVLLNRSSAVVAICASGVVAATAAFLGTFRI